MKRSLILLLAVIFLSGCATYRFHRGPKPPLDKGYVVSRDDIVIPEYTIGHDQGAPADIELARERFKRRRKRVEYYYKKMDVIDNHFNGAVWKPLIMFSKLAAGIFRLPFIMISDYRYHRNPAYKEKIESRLDELDAREDARMDKLRVELGRYIQRDMISEDPSLAPAPVASPPAPKKEEKIIPKKAAVPRKLVIAEEKKPGICAVIVAKPVKGYSPLQVSFSASRSRSTRGRIISYSWDFGDGDTSDKRNSINTFYSTSFDPRQFTVTLTVTDDKGSTATASITIEVLNK
ncbi:PKD domain-containing protein [Candidatus Omnitrophota bacterium]